MKINASQQPLLVIVGPTGSGKSAVALKLAQLYEGEIIAADSRTVYRGMDIGTAKPSVIEQKEVPHHMLDLVEVNERCTVADFQSKANTVIRDIFTRNHLPIVVGGSGLYVDALLYDYEFRQDSSDQSYNSFSDDELREQVSAAGITLNESDIRNRRRLLRAAATGRGAVSQRKKLHPGSLVIGLSPPPERLAEQMTERTSSWLEEGLIEEARRLFDTFGAAEPLNTTPYKEVAGFLRGEYSLQDAEQLINLHLRQLVKRQLTWFNRNTDIQWVGSPREALECARLWQESAIL